MIFSFALRRVESTAISFECETFYRFVFEIWTLKAFSVIKEMTNVSL